MTDRSPQLADAGVSVWLDDLSRDRLVGGSLAALIEDAHVVGVTTNPTIFAEASRATRTTTSSADLRQRGADREEAVRAITTYDVRCGLRRPARRSTTTTDGRTAGSPSRSTRGWPTTRDDDHRRGRARCGGWSTGRTCSSRSRPPRRACRPSTAGAGRGHQRQRHADLLPRALPPGDGGLPARPGAGRSRRRTTCRRHRLSVASFFVSRVDTEVDKRLEKIGSDEARRSRGKAAVANARLAYAGLRGGLRRASERWARCARPAPSRSGRCGRRPASRTPTTPTPCTSTSWSRRARSTRCRRRRWRRSPSTARSAATRSPAPTPTPSRS